MTRDQLAARHAAAIRRHWRTLADCGGVPSADLLEDLADIAEDHAGERTAEALEALTDEQAAGNEPSRAAADRPAPRRTPQRRTAK